MIYRELGKTGLRVSILGYGGSSLGGTRGSVTRDEGRRAVRAALDAGINFIDTSPYYGLTTAESALGDALRGVPRDRFILATKVGRYGNDAFDFSAARVTASVDESLARLGVDHVDLIQCHDIEFTSLNRVIGETLPALEAVRRRGKARFIGITGLPLKVFGYFLGRVPDGAVDTVLSYCHHTLFDDTLLDLIPAFEARGVGIINAAPLAMGLFSGHPPPDWHPAPPSLRAACALAAEHCRARGAVLAELALRYALADPRVDTTLVGTPKADEVRRNARCVGTSPDPVLLAEVTALLAPVRNMTWPSGLPENN